MLARGVATIGLDFSTVAGRGLFGRAGGGFGVDSLDEVDALEVPDFFGFILAVRPLAGTAALLGAEAKAWWSVSCIEPPGVLGAEGLGRRLDEDAFACRGVRLF